MNNVNERLRKMWSVPKFLICALMCMLPYLVHAQSGMTVKGKVLDHTGQPIIGASVVEKGTTNGAITDFDGNFTLKVDASKTLVFSFIGFTSQELPASANMNVTLVEDVVDLEDIVVVGYGQQKKASVVGAITQTTGEVLERAAGITDVGAALTGNLPGVITTQSTGLPGAEEPQIVIRGSSSPNNTNPLVLVDGIERPMTSVDMASVETISVLKDASATAVYGVKGANGVILITTKRGKEGKAMVNVSANAVMKMVSKLPGKLDSYDALMARNMAIEHELNVKPDSWGSINPQSFIDMYRNQQTQEDRERYVNVDWQDIMFKKHAMSYNANLNILGGTKHVRYFASADFVNEADMFKKFESDRGYDSGFGFNKITVRSNLDFNITRYTTLKVNLAGSIGSQKTGYTGIASIGDWGFAQNWAAVYNIAPDVFVPKYSDGSWGYYPGKSNVTNSPQNIALSGISKTNTTRITSDFILEQDLSFLTDGLNFRGSLSFDNTFVSTAQRIADLYNDPQNKWIDPYTGKETTKQNTEAYNQFDYAAGIKWTTEGGSVDNGQTQRNLNYQLQLNYARTFGQNDVTAMGMFQRQEHNKGSDIPSFREDWVFRVTYSYDGKYHLEYNGAYNGSEKFSKDNRFAFFNSGAIGWTISEENFMTSLRDSKIIDFLKLRASYGEIGDDGGVPRFAYMSEWAYGGQTIMGEKKENSSYQWFKESKVGNDDVHWEVVRKFNFGIDYSFAGGIVAGTVEIFKDKRSDVYVGGGDRATPAWFGQSAVAANLGEIHNKGYEIEIRLNKQFQNGIRAWANLNYTHAENEVIRMDDAELLADYRKSEGYAIGQTRAHVSGDRMQSYDDLLAAPMFDVNNTDRLAGDYYIVDFNGDGVVDSNDSNPWGYSGTPQNTYNATLGVDYKGWSCFAQFYGVSNVTREVGLTSFGNQLNNVYDTGTWWSENPNDAEKVTARWGSQLGYGAGTENLYDGSYLRLKNVELAYTFDKLDLGSFALKNLKLFVSGNNLWVWTKMPDDRESNFAGASNQGQYPTVKRVNFGLKFSL